MNAVEIKNLTVTYGENIALENFNLEVEEGTLMALVGPNGAGKSTLIKTILGFLKQITGEIKINSKSLDEATEYIQNKLNEIPENSRYLITAHDAFGYFAEQFGLQVKAIQGVSTDSEIGAKQIDDLSNFIVEHNIKAIFVESSVNHKSIEALQEAVKAKGANVEIGGELYSDSMGDNENNTETYIKTVKANADTISNALK